ncbi:MAG: type II secretion system protein [bacterium]
MVASFNKNKKINTGFTLIEMMVSISIFSIVMVVVIGALLLLSDANKKAQAVRAVVDNLNFAIEDITRNLRTGKDYSCVVLNLDGSIGTPATCTNGQATKGVVFKGACDEYDWTDLKCISYKCYAYIVESTVKDSVTGTITRNGTLKYAEKTTDQEGENSCNTLPWNISDFSNLISPEVLVNDGQFYVVNPDVSANKQQPITIIDLNGEFVAGANAGGEKLKTPFNIQTTVSQRSGIN